MLNNLIKKILQSDYLFYLYLIIVISIAHYPIISGIYTPKYDMIDVYFPWRNFISECLNSRLYPLWNPYQDFGYPIIADGSSGAWYPLVILISFITGYSIKSIVFEIWFHVVLGGIGFYKLSRTINYNRYVSLLLSISYSLSGVSIGNGQHLTYLISLCWIPYCFNYFYKINHTNNITSILKFSICFYLLITGGYLAFVFILFYILIILFFINIFKNLNNIERIKNVIFNNSLTLLLTIIITFGYIYTLVETKPYISRSNNFNYIDASFGPFTPQSTISLLIPFATVRNPEIWDTDISMANSYFGVILLGIYIISIFNKNTKFIKIIFILSVLSLLASFGDYTPVRKFLFDYIPLMNLFRFPSIFRYFFIFGSLIISGNYLNSINKENFKVHKYKFLYTFSILVLTYVLVLVIVFRKFTINNIFSINIINENFNNTYKYFDNIAFQSLYTIVFLLILILFIYKIKYKYFYKILIFFSSVEILISFHLNAPFTFFYKHISLKDTYLMTKKFPSGFPLLEYAPLSVIHDNLTDIYPFTRNKCIFLKKICYDGFNSFQMLNKTILEDKYNDFFRLITNNNIFYFSNKLVNIDIWNHIYDSKCFEKETVVLNNKFYDFLSKKLSYFDSTSTIKYIYYNPQKFIVETKSDSDNLLIFMQNFHPSWSAKIDNNESKIYISNFTFMSVFIPKGNHIVKFEYNNKNVKLFYNFSAIIFVLITLFILILKLNSYYKKNSII